MSGAEAQEVDVEELEAALLEHLTDEERIWFGSVTAYRKTVESVTRKLLVQIDEAGRAGRISEQLGKTVVQGMWRGVQHQADILRALLEMRGVDVVNQAPAFRSAEEALSFLNALPKRPGVPR